MPCKKLAVDLGDTPCLDRAVLLGDYASYVEVPVWA